jgi:hypothetical protein
MKHFGIWVLLGCLIGCSKSEPTIAEASRVASVAPSTAANGSLESTEMAQSEAAPGTAAANEPTPAAASAPGGAPTSFKAGTKQNIAGAVGLGCEATSLDGWLQLLCRKKNGTGGRPLRAIVKTPGEDAAAAAQGREPGSDAHDEGETTGQELVPNEYGELSIVVPFGADEQRDVAIEWSDTRYTLHLTGGKATLEWAASGIPHRRACQQLLEESRAVVAQAQKGEGDARLTVTEATKLPRFGVCQAAGLGSWALALTAATGKGEGAARLQHLQLDVVRVEVDGTRRTASFGSFDVAPAGLELSALQVYDYDDDGRNELIVPYEVKSTGGQVPTLPPAIWSFSDAGVTPYTKAPSIAGGLGVEHLDFDMRPDLGSYGGFVGWLGPDCGLKACPGRVTGPKLYFHSLPDGSFSDSDEAVRGAFKRGCPSKPASVVAEQGGSLNATQTAKNLVCARAHGLEAAAISGELAAKRGLLCGSADKCALEETLLGWLDRALPLDLSGPAPKK